MVGFDTSDDASVYKISEELALIQTVDIFPPVVDDPYAYGQIAAANSLSDVYAMGGNPKIALNILCYPEKLPKETVQGILQGGYEKVLEADAIISGGHTLKDTEPKYGLSVTGFAHPKDILLNSSAKLGDILIYTKALGTGILTTAEKAGILKRSEYLSLVKSMTTLNKYVADIMKGFPVNSCTDITGFGFLGHTYEMAVGSDCTIKIETKNLPILPGAVEHARLGIIPAGAYDNRNYLEKFVQIGQGVKREIADILFDPQTSGGLLISLPETEGLKLIGALNDSVPTAKIVGHVLPYQDNHVIVE